MKKTFTILLTLILCICMLSAFAVAVSATEQENEATNAPSMPVITKPYQTVAELGIDIEEIDALFPQTLEASYDNGRLYVADMEYSKVYVYTENGYFYMELSDGVWSAEIGERTEGTEYIYVTCESSDASCEWTTAYVSGTRDPYVTVTANNASFTVSAQGYITIVYDKDDGRRITDRYSHGVLQEHEVNVMVSEDYTSYVVYGADGNVLYIAFYIYDIGNWFYLFPNQGWSSNWSVYTPCNAPAGYENLDANYFIEKMPSLICFHEEWSDATCAAPKTCKKCGETEGEVLSHSNVMDATCTAPKTCADCGYTEGEALGHIWIPLEGVCSVCDSSILPEIEFENTVYGNLDETGFPYEELRSIFPYEVEIKYENGKYMIKDIGASEAEGYTNIDYNRTNLTLVDGYWVYEVSEEIYNDDDVDIYVCFSGTTSTGHWLINYENGRIDSSLQINSADYSRIALVYFYSDWVEFIYYVGDRSYRDMYKNGVLSKQTVDVYVGDDRLVMDYNADGTPTYVQLYAADGNYYSYFSEGGWTTYPGSYDENYACDAPAGFENADMDYFTSLLISGIGCTHETYGAATCTEPERCAVCGLNKEGSEALGHNVVDATCEDPSYCKVCQSEFDEELGHNVVTDEAVAPTCTKTGLTEGEHCARCEEIIVEQEEIEALEHDWNEGQITTEPTCTVKGVKTFTCKNDETHNKTEEIDALGHKYDNACDKTCNTCQTERTPAEHTDADGNEKCDTCGYDMPKTSIDPGEGNTNKDNTDENNGLSTGAIVGIAVGSVAVVGLGGFSLFWFVIKKKSWRDLIGVFGKK